MNHQYEVLCIGVNKVPGKAWQELKYAEKNAVAVAEYFKTLKDKAHVTLFTGKDAARPNIINWMEKCSASPGELKVILFFSGRSSVEKNENKKSLERCLWVHGHEGTGPNANPEVHPLKMPEILKLLNNPLHQLIIIIDACCSFGQGISPGDIFQQFKKTERMTSLKRYVIISASAVSESVFEDPTLRYGVLTYYLLQTLSGKYTFFLKKQIAFFRFLEVLDRKVRTHGFATITGRKRLHPMPMENGVMVHYSDKNFKLPVLEPIPFIIEPGSNFFQQKISQLAHFFTRTRLRTKILLMGLILGILLLLVYLVHGSMVTIHFTPPRHAAIGNTLLTKQRFPLDKLEGQMLGKKYYQEFSLYLFRHNWVDTLLRKLDEKGRIVLLGNLLGRRLTGIDETQLKEFAFKNMNDVFYWNRSDIMKLMRIISREYAYFGLNRKGMVLELLAKLGKTGKITALEIFDLKKDTDEGLRKLFLKYFYTAAFLEKNIHYLNPHDYLYMLENKKQLPASIDIPLRRETERYLVTVAASIPDSHSEMTKKMWEVYGKIKILLTFARHFPLFFQTQFSKKTETYFRTVAESIPGTHIKITDRNKLEEIYEKLRILAVLGSNHFREKAAAIFKKAFDPVRVMSLFRECSNFQDKLWLLAQYFKRVKRAKNFQHPDNFWHEFIYGYFRTLPRQERTGILKTILDTNVEAIPEDYRNNFLHHLRDVDTTLITLQDWENWIERYPVALQYAADPIIEGNYAEVFSLLQRHPAYFSEIFTGPVFQRLYQFNKTRTVNLVKRIFEIGDEEGQLNAAVFLYNKNYHTYSSFIIEFLERAKDNTHKQHLLKEFYGSINEAVIQLMSKDNQLKESLKPLLFQPNLFYRFFKTNMQFWPQEVIQRVLTTKIPKNYDYGRPLLRISERLPGAYRKKMLVKICKAEIDEGFRINAESTLVKHYPGEFLKLVFNSKYKWQSSTKREVVNAYQALSYNVLIDELILSLREKSYRKVGFICEALINKDPKEKSYIKELQHILAAFNRPLERILLRQLRHYMHKQKFLRGSRGQFF